MASHEEIGAVVLAGGLARRMGGGHKALLEVGGRPILSHILDRLQPQSTDFILNVNQDQEKFSDFELPITADSINGFAGPLAGILAGMDWFAEHCLDMRYMISVAGDTPFIPTDLMEKLSEPVLTGKSEMSVAVSSGRTQPVIGLWDINLREDLRRAIFEEEIYKVDRWTARYKLAEVSFEDIPHPPFFNVNRPEELAIAEEIFQQHYAE